jgi:beta-N-acetylhexosaminidase
MLYKLMKTIARLITFCLIIMLLTPLTLGQAAILTQVTTPEESARLLLSQLTPEEKVGQLFLVTFNGASAEPHSQIYDLIVNRHIGGVVLWAQNDNFLATDQTLPIALNLNRQLQAAEYYASTLEQPSSSSGIPYRPRFIPLFIGISQEGDGYPYDQIMSGLTPLPSQMALGATWDTSLAQQVGSVVGSELSLLGFNLLFGPSLDVLDSPHTEGSGDLGIRTFGGDPYWVGIMGGSYISGVHEGSNGEMAVVAKHFPGYGSSDRLPEEEVATVRKSLEQLKQIELYPFFSVTGDAPTQQATTDALLTSHIRYQGFQENIRATTKPVSIDPQAFSQLMSLPPFTSWLDNGGLMITDELGGQAMRRFYESSGQTFVPKYIARDAFLAGNDILYTGNFATPPTDSYTNVIATLDFFTQKYLDDTAFAQRVDQSVLRILTLKYRLYKNSFTYSGTLAPQDVSGAIGKSGQVTFEVLKEAATLVNPSQSELNTVLPDPPGRTDRIVFITDTRNGQQCSNCPLQPVIPVNALEQAVIRLYSPQAGGQILPGNLVSYSFDDLLNLLNTGTGILQIENDLRSARYIVFSMLDQNPSVPSSQALKLFLARRPDLLPQKRIIVFSFNAPYYLDATDISKLTAYYALYTKTPKAIDTAARLLGQEIRAVGSLPVTVTGVNYDLNTVTFPDPNQTIELKLDVPPGQQTAATITPAPSPMTVKVGDTLPVRTGVILDHNGHPVPDNTIVHFIVTHGEGSLAQTTEAQTFQGIARTSIRVDVPGPLEVRVESEPAKNSNTLKFNAPPEPGTPTSPTPTVTASPTHTVTPSPTLTETPVAIIQPPEPRGRTNMTDWLLAILLIAAIGAFTYWFSSTIGQVRWGVRGALLTTIGGMLAYTYLALGMPGTQAVVQNTGTMGVLLITIIGAGAGWAAAWGWKGLKETKKY